MDRRNFLGWVGVSWLASCLPLALAACSSKETGPPPIATTPIGPRRSDGYHSVATVSELNQTGQLLVKNFPAGAVLLVQNPEASNAVSALNPTCTHRGCEVAWKAEQQAFVCPCHHAKFSATGEVLASPAKRPLKTYAAKIEGDSVLVKSA